MMRIIELESLVKEREQAVYVVTVGDEKVGVSTQDLIDLIRAKHMKALSRKMPARQGKPMTAESVDVPSLNLQETIGA